MTKKEMTAPPPAYEDALADYALLAAVENEHAHQVAVASQTHQMRSAVAAVQNSLGAADPATAGGHLEHAVAILRAKVVADAALAHLLDDALTRLGIKVPAWVTSLQNLLDKASKPVVPEVVPAEMAPTT
jgi:hypothetical protein